MKRSAEARKHRAAASAASFEGGEVPIMFATITRW